MKGVKIVIAMVPLMRFRVGLTIIFMIVVSSNLLAADRASYQVILVPLSLHSPVPGANGSLWETEIWVRNNGPTPLPFTNGAPICTVLCPTPDPFTLPPHETVRWHNRKSSISISTGRLIPGLLWYVDRQRSDELSTSARVRDLSRAFETWGTEIPIIRESELFASQMVMLRVPTENGFRTNLRVYDARTDSSSAVRIRVFSEDTEALLIDEVVELERGVLERVFAALPHYFELFDLGSMIEPAASTSTVRIEIDSLSGERQLWAFASVTHNETQHVTIVSPQ